MNNGVIIGPRGALCVTITRHHILYYPRFKISESSCVIISGDAASIRRRNSRSSGRKTAPSHRLCGTFWFVRRPLQRETTLTFGLATLHTFFGTMVRSQFRCVFDRRGKSCPNSFRTPSRELKPRRRSLNRCGVPKTNSGTHRLKSQPPIDLCSAGMTDCLCEGCGCGGPPRDAAAEINVSATARC